MTEDQALISEQGSDGVRIRSLQKVYYPSPPWLRVLVRTNIREPIHAIKEINLDVAPGEICAVVGPNGAGKTTTFRILVGLTTLTGGSARIMGYDCNDESPAVRRLVGWMPAEDRSLLMRLTCAENLHFHGRLQGMRGDHLRKRIVETLEQVGLGHAHDNSVFSLSAGMRARLQLARALLHSPEVLILDEPTGSVDPVASHELLNLIIEIVAEERLATLISSHRLEEIEALHSHVILLDKGEVRYDGDLDDLRREWELKRVDLTFSSPEAARLATDTIITKGIAMVERKEDAELEVTLPTDASTGSLLHGLADHVADVVRISESQTPLRDILAHMYQRTNIEDAGSDQE